MYDNVVLQKSGVDPPGRPTAPRGPHPDLRSQHHQTPPTQINWGNPKITPPKLLLLSGYFPLRLFLKMHPLGKKPKSGLYIRDGADTEADFIFHQTVIFCLICSLATSRQCLLHHYIGSGMGGREAGRQADHGPCVTVQTPNTFHW